MAKKDTSATAVALIDLHHLSAPAGSILQGPAAEVASLVSVGAADEGKEALAHAKAQGAAVVKIPDAEAADQSEAA
jgi:hypothetical protein